MLDFKWCRKGLYLQRIYFRGKSNRKQIRNRRNCCAATVEAMMTSEIKNGQIRNHKWSITHRTRVSSHADASCGPSPPKHWEGTLRESASCNSHQTCSTTCFFQRWRIPGVNPYARVNSIKNRFTIV